MPLWGSVDNAANSAISALMQVNKTINSSNRTELFGNVTANVYNTGAITGQFGVDAAEGQAVPGVTHAGWVLRKEGTGGRAGRVTYETLVAMGSMTADAENSKFPQVRITIRTQPQSKSVANNSATTFGVDAGTRPEGGTITYQWQVNGSNLTNGGVYSNVTTPLLSISNVATLSGNSYGVLLYSAGAQTIMSANATLTVV